MTATDADLYAIDHAGALTPLVRPDDLPVAAHGLAAVTADTRPLLARALGEHPAHGDTPALTLLVPPRPAPDAACSKHLVTAFIATGGWVRAMLQARDLAAPDLCYRLLSAILAGPEPAARLRIVDRTTPDDVVAASSRPSIDVILPHRGGAALLGAALDGLSRQTLPARTILCFDERPDPALVRRLAGCAALALHQVVPDPAGPYVPRQHFALSSTADYVAFQDLDDISMPARLAMLAAAAASGADLAGSHELRCDEINRRVAAIRYPLDVNRALDLCDGSVQLFPATLVDRATLQRLGGFSTDRTFGADRQFQLRAYGSARIVNVDAFLYVRRRRAASLSTSAETGMQSPERLRINRDWDAALARVRNGAPADDEGALAVTPSATDFAIRDLRTGRVAPALLRTPPGADRTPPAIDQSYSDADAY